MLTLTEIFAILIIHWFADFVLQTDKQAKGKSKNWKDLLSHTKMYSFIWLVSGCLYLYIKYQSFCPPKESCINVLYFTLITFIAHTITDYFTSRINSKLFPRFTLLTMENGTFGDTELIAFPKSKFSLHNFFVGVGFDQILHYVQLFLTYYLLK